MRYTIFKNIKKVSVFFFFSASHNIGQNIKCKDSQTKKFKIKTVCLHPYSYFAMMLIDPKLISPPDLFSV